MRILSSATRIVLLAFTGAIVAALFTGRVTSDQFMAIAGVVFGAFFALKSSPVPPSDK